MAEEKRMEANAASGAVQDIAAKQNTYDTVFDAMIAQNVSPREKSQMETAAYNGAAHDLAAAQPPQTAQTPQDLMARNARDTIAAFVIPSQETRSNINDL